MKKHQILLHAKNFLHATKKEKNESELRLIACDKQPVRLSVGEGAFSIENHTN